MSHEGNDFLKEKSKDESNQFFKKKEKLWEIEKNIKKSGMKKTKKHI